MNPWVIAVLAAGGLLGGAVASALSASSARHPHLADTLRLMDERRIAPIDPAEPESRHRLSGWAARLPFPVPDDDLALLSLHRRQAVLRAAVSAAGYALAGPAIATTSAVLDLGSPFVIPAGFAVAGMIVGWTGTARRFRRDADTARDELRSALVSYLQQVGLLRRGGAGVSTALALPARLLTDSWAMRRIHDELELAERAGAMPWEGLRRFGERVGVDELTDLSRIAVTAGQDGGAVVDTLLARSESLRDELLADEHAVAHRASGQMSTPGALQVFLIAAWVLFPAATALLSSV